MECYCNIELMTMNMSLTLACSLCVSSYTLLYIVLDESPTGFLYAPIFTDFFLLFSQTMTFGLSLRPLTSLAMFILLLPILVDQS